MQSFYHRHTFSRSIMRIVILSLAVGLNKILSSRLQKPGFLTETVDYSKPLRPQIENADVLVNGLGRIDRSIIDFCPNLKLVQQVGTGIDNVDIKYCNARSIYVAHVPKANSVAVAEHTLFLMTYMAKNIKAAEKGLMQNRVLNVLGSQLYGKILLIIGLGYIGSEVAKRAKAFGMNVIAVTKHPESRDVDKALYQCLSKVVPPGELLQCLPQADYVSLHTSLTDETKGMIADREFGLMKKNAYLINVARAQIVDRNSLFEALSKARIGGAAFDVFWEEPANPGDPLLQLENFVLTPHIAGWTIESANSAAEIMTRNIELVASGDPPSTSITAK